MPTSVQVTAGETIPVAVSARNPSNGVVTLAHPLGCTPRLDHTEICAQTVELVGPGQTVNARYTIDARGITPGSYTLNIEGLRTINVTVTA